MAGEGGPGVLVTLVRAAGSTYRLPGARLLALPDGRVAGTISGGCLEADLLRKAGWRVRDGAVLQRYNTGFEDTAEVPFGLGCGGAVDLLLEGAETAEAKALIQALTDTLHGDARIVATVLPEDGNAFSRVVLSEEGDLLFATAALPAEQVAALRRLLRLPWPSLSMHDEARSRSGFFVESLAPAQRFFVFGAGEDARPLVRMASEMGWTAMVIDSHPQLARRERFPEAAEVRVVDSASVAGVTARDAVAVMTHSYEQDRRAMAELLPLAPCYLGLLGARQRSALLLREAAEMAGLEFAEALRRVHAPIGLELGGDGPEQIALAIVAEVQHALHPPAAAEAGAVENRRMSLAQATVLLAQFGAVNASAACALDAASSALDAASSSQDAALSAQSDDEWAMPAGWNAVTNGTELSR